MPSMMLFSWGVIGSESNMHEQTRAETIPGLGLIYDDDLMALSP